jgi:carbon starvation protein
MIENENQIRFIGYCSMLVESFVAIMAMIAASTIEPGIYFAMNSPSAVIGTDPTHAATVISSWGFHLTPDMLADTAKAVGESTLMSRAGGAPTLAVGMAQIFSGLFGSTAMMGFWYHFAILFEALFILTAVDAGTRVARFMIQDLAGSVVPGLQNTQNWINNILCSALAVTLWGYILYAGVKDPLGGINSLWPLFGISNQMLAAIALTLVSVVLFKMKRAQWAWVSILPAIWLLICTLTAGFEKMFHSSPTIGFMAHADKFNTAIAQHILIAPAASLAEMQQIVFNDYVNFSLSAAFVLIVLLTLMFGLIAIRRSFNSTESTACEIA